MNILLKNWQEQKMIWCYRVRKVFERSATVGPEYEMTVRISRFNQLEKNRKRLRQQLDPDGNPFVRVEDNK